MSFLPQDEQLKDRLIFVMLLAIAAALYWPVVEIRPLRGDNLYVLAWVHARPFSALATIDPAIYPEWRPLAYLTIWIEHHLVRLDGVALHWAVNLVTWTACAWLAYRITSALTASRSGALVTALLLLIDRRVEQPLTWIIERQTLMACLFGLMALYVLVVRGRDRALSPREWFSISALLIASALSKEYGLAFAIAIAVGGAWNRSRLQLAAAFAPVAIYAVLRAGLAAGAVSGPYCESMGYFFATEDRCVDPSTATGVAQMTYNAGASVVGTLVPGLFSDEGAIEINGVRVAKALTLLTFVVIGLRRLTPRLLPLMLLPFATGAMNFMLYRPRNQLIGVLGIAIFAGIGFAALTRTEPATRRLRPIAFAAMTAMLILIGSRAYVAHAAVASIVVDMLNQDPCQSRLRSREYGDRFAKLVKRHYRMPDPMCEGSHY